jgi:hypothetical protein
MPLRSGRPDTRHVESADHDPAGNPVLTPEQMRAARQCKRVPGSREHQMAAMSASPSRTAAPTLSHGVDGGLAQTPAPTKPGSCGPDGVGAYVTNEVFLYRVIGTARSDVDEMVVLEDCFLLDVAPVPIKDFHARRLRVVIPATGND